MSRTPAWNWLPNLLSLCVIGLMAANYFNPFADLGNWAGYAERALEERDDLALVANIRSSHSTSGWRT